MSSIEGDLKKNSKLYCKIFENIVAMQCRFQLNQILRLSGNKKALLI